MKAEYDIIENIEIKEKGRETNYKFNIKVLVALACIFLIIIFFSTTYYTAYKYFEGLEKSQELLQKDNIQTTRKTYYLEQKIRKDLEKMQKKAN